MLAAQVQQRRPSVRARLRQRAALERRQQLPLLRLRDAIARPDRGPAGEARRHPIRPRQPLLRLEPIEQIGERLRRIGIGDHLYAHIVTSGDATRRALERRDEPFYAALGPAYYFLGKEADAGLLHGLDCRRSETPEDADFLLVTGPTDDSLGLDDYQALLVRAAGLALPMVCANPDLAVIRGGAREPCAGALAARYAELGGAVGYQGKPYPGVYEMVFEALGGIDRDRILCVGDGLATDIPGAVAAGLDSLLVTGGLLADAWGVERTLAPDPARLEAACRDAGVTPTAAIPTFVW